MTSEATRSAQPGAGSPPPAAAPHGGSRTSGGGKVSGPLAIFTSTMGGGGAQRSMVKLAGAIAHRGFEVDLVLIRAEGHYRSEVSEAVRVIDLGARRALASIPPMVRYLRRERPAALLSSLDYVNIVGLWARRLSGVETRMIVSERNTLSSVVQNASRFRTKLRPPLMRWFYPWADGIVAVSRGVADDLTNMTGITSDRVQVIYNPVISPLLREMASAPLDHPWFRPGEPPVVLGLGRLKPQKDFGVLIEAFAHVRETRQARLLILGEGPERGRLESTVRRLGLENDVQLPGWVVNPYPFMSRSGLFVLSSRWEGLPGALIEALYCSVPVVSTDCPSGPREILEDGRHGLLVPVGDVPALARAIDIALSGAGPRPSPDTWRAFDQEVVVDRYLEALLGTRHEREAE